MRDEGVSPELAAFIAEVPIARGGKHFEFIRGVAASLPKKARLLDVGCGNAPYRELFRHLDYVTCDHADSEYSPTVPPDIVAPADQIPVPDCSFDGVLCTQVLEHVPEPLAVLAELKRVLRPSASLWITAPLTWYLHEEPRDFYRYTSHGLRYLLERAGFIQVDVRPLNDAFSTLSQLVGDLGWMMGRPGDAYDNERDVVSLAMKRLAEVIGSFANYDSRWVLPIDYAATATRR